MRNNILFKPFSACGGVSANARVHHVHALLLSALVKAAWSVTTRFFRRDDAKAIGERLFRFLREHGKAQEQ